MKHRIVLIAAQEWTVMTMIKKINKKFRTKLNNGIFHDTRSDVNVLAEYCNMLSSKINEIIDEIERNDENAVNEKGSRSH